MRGRHPAGIVLYNTKVINVLVYNRYLQGLIQKDVEKIRVLVLEALVNGI